jgi:ankyrin repeat protein
VANDKAQTLVHFATKSAASGVLEYLLEKGANIYTPNWLGLTPLHTAILASDLNAVALILKYNPNLNALSLEPETELVPTSPTGPSMTPLVMAVQKRSLPLIRMLLDAGADVNIASARGWTALHLAVILGYEDVVDAILSHPSAASSLPDSPPKLNMDLVDESGNTCLHYAVQRQSVSLVRRLLDSGALPTVTNQLGQLPIHLYDGSISMAEVLIRASSPIDHLCHAEVPDQKQTALLIACGKSDPSSCLELAQMLINAGANVNLKSHTGLSPLHSAVSSANFELINLLISAHAEVNTAELVDGNSPLHIAIQMKSLLLVRLLLKSGADVNLIGPKSTHPPCVYLAVAFRHEDVFSELLACPIDQFQLTWTSPDGFTAFQVASANGEPHLIRSMLERFPEQAQLLLASCTSTGKTPLLLATEAGSTQCVKLLIDASASAGVDTIDTPDASGMAPIHYVCKQGRSNIAKLLLEAGANVNILASGAKAPITLAMEH